MRVHLVAHSHIDPAWTWDKYEGIDEVLNTFRAACDRLDEYPEVRFSASSLQFYEWVLEHDRALFARIRRHVRSGRWEIVGGWWVEGDANLPTLESFLKHAELSQAFSKKHFGITIRVAFLPDTFGHQGTLPAILARTGFKYFMFCRPDAGEKRDLPDDLFYWKCGRERILTYRARHYYGNPAGWTEPTFLAKLDAPEFTSDKTNCVMYGMGDHGGAMTIAEIEFSRRYIAGKPAGDTAFSTMEAFFREAGRRKNIPSYTGDLHYHAIGCYSVLRNIKEGVREAEHQLALANRAMTMAGAKGNERFLNPLWKRVLFNQFHDVLPGSCIRTTADQAVAELHSVTFECREKTYASLKKLSGRKPVRFKEGEFRIFNTLSHAVTAPLNIESLVYFKPGAVFKDSTGRTIPIQEVVPRSRAFTHRWEFVDTLPARGCKSYRFEGGSIIGDVTRYEFPTFSSGERIECETSAVDSAGMIQLAGRDVLVSPVGFLLMRDDSDLWGHGVRAYDQVEDRFVPVMTSVLTGPVTCKLHQRLRCRNSTVDIIYEMFKGVPGVRADIEVNWAEDRKILKMEIQPALSGASSFLMQAAGGVMERKADGMELPLHHWLWLPTEGGKGMGLIQSGAFACDCVNGRLRTTLIRSNIYSNHVPYVLRTEDPQPLTDQGVHTFRFWLLPDVPARGGPLEKAAAEFLEPYAVIRDGFNTRRR